MRITIKAQMPVIPVVSRIWVDFDAMLDNLETLNFRAFEKGLLTDTEQVKFNDTIERLRKEMREFWMEELKEPSHMQKYRMLAFEALNAIKGPLGMAVNGELSAISAQENSHREMLSTIINALQEYRRQS